MREILFRGKSKDTNEWVYGDLLFCADTAQIWEDTDHGKFNCLVDPDSVGQYTGMLDKNGCKIFEGDVIKHSARAFGELITNLYEVRYSTEQARFLALLSSGVFNPTAFQDCEVVGNIFDNPELLGDDKT